MFDFRKMAAALLALGIAGAPGAMAWTQRTSGPDAQTLVVEKGRSAVVEADAPFSTLVVADPDVAEAMATSNRSFFLRGKQPGTTTVLVYGADGKIDELIDVEVELALDDLRTDISNLLPGEDIQVYPVHDGVFLDGKATTAAAADMALQVAERYVPGGVANGLTIGQSQQVLLEVRFLEASRNTVKEIGFGNSIDANDVVASTESSTLSGLAEKTVALFKNIGGENIDVTLRALEKKGVIR
ncbi:MAG TPA: pilus assembly protein N-terminal domain-containing protein, partial [Hyphomonas sp.]|nr:pilus assembly protein N-terminal domain-containing protein [Hyphomonas sp.]